MIVHVLTHHPERYRGYLNSSIMWHARNTDKLHVEIVDLNNFDVLRDAVASVTGWESAHKIMAHASGSSFTQPMAYRSARHEHIILYAPNMQETVDASWVDAVWNVNDNIDPDIATMMLVDAITRLAPEVLNKEESHLHDSFNDGLLEHPHYTRPRVIDGKEVPAVLLSGNHAEIARWRHEQSLKRTKERRPDLYEQYIKTHKK